MSGMDTIYAGARKLIEEAVRKEIRDKGHTLTGALEASLDGTTKQEAGAYTLTGTASDYMKYVNDGFPAASASFKQMPFLIEYFKKRGLPEKEATNAAAATIKVWMKEGMSTEASKRFSPTGKRQKVLEDAMEAVDPELTTYMSEALDKAVDELYRKEKSETI